MRAVILAVVATGCSAGFEGMYQTTGVVTLAAPCTGAGAPQTVPANRAYLEVSTSKVGIIEVLTIRGCTSTDPATCTTSIAGLFPVDGEYKLAIGQTGSTTPCHLRYAVIKIVRVDDRTIEVRNGVYEQDDASVPAAQCTGQLAIDRGEAMTCSDLSIMTAVSTS